MGITVSHTNYAPISLVSALIGFVSFTFTLGTFLKVFWSNLGTFSAAPQEITDYLSSLKQGLLEERRHLRRVRRRLKSVRRDRSRAGLRSDDDEHTRAGTGVYGAHGAGRRSRDGRSRRHRMFFDRDVQSMRSAGEDEVLRVLRTTVHDLVKKFRALESPFLKPEFQTQDAAAWSTADAYAVDAEKRPYARAGSAGSEDEPAAQMRRSNRLGSEYRKCGFVERWLWVRTKAQVITLSEVLSRVEVRRTAHEVGEVLNMVCDIGRDIEELRGGLEGVEGRLNRVIGVRRVD